MRPQLGGLLCLLALLALGPACLAQAAPDAGSATAPLEGGSLVVWMVSPATAAQRNVLAAQKRAAALTVTLPTTVQQQTAGSFGTPSSNIGQTAGSYGQTAGSLGTASSNTGQTAGSYARAPSELGTEASLNGGNAGDYGQTAGSFGQPSGNAGTTAGDYSSAFGPGHAGPPPSVTASRVRDELSNGLRHSFPNLRVLFVNVLAEELDDRLAAAKPDAFPDVLVGAAVPAQIESSGRGLHMLGWPASFEAFASFADTDRDRLGAPSRYTAVLGANLAVPPFERQRIVILRRAPHPQEARAFTVWVRDEGLCRACETPHAPEPADIPAAVAMGTVQRVLGGSALGVLPSNRRVNSSRSSATSRDAVAGSSTGTVDPEAADFSGVLAASLAFEGAPAEPSGASLRLARAATRQGLDTGALNFDVSVLEGKANLHFAVVLLRGIAHGPDAFGVLHSLVVLRRNDAGIWQVLQVSPNVSPALLKEQASELARFASPASPTNDAKLTPVSLASPPDGDNRQRVPDLWWDNNGTAGLEVVEWQTRLLTTGTSGWTDSRLMMVPDRDPKVQTRIPAQFAQSEGPYRWRVWSVGTGGVLVISAWRSFNVLP